MGAAVFATLETTAGRKLRDFASPLEFSIRPAAWQALDRQPWEAIRAGLVVGEVAVCVNHGRWVVDCPVEGCNGAQFASETDPRFVCVECGSGPFSVVWPEGRAAIEEVLAVRPQPNRNWFPGESVDGLRAENSERGL